MARGRNSSALAAIGLLALTLAGCGAGQWSKPGAGDAQLATDLAACESAVESRLDDFAARLEDTSRGVESGGDAFYLRDDVRDFGARRRRGELVAACMEAEGYSGGGDGGFDLGLSGLTDLL